MTAEWWQTRQRGHKSLRNEENPPLVVSESIVILNELTKAPSPRRISSFFFFNLFQRQNICIFDILCRNQ